MSLAEWMRNVIVGLSAFSCGMALYLAVLNFRFGMKPAERYQWNYGLARISHVIIVMLIAELVYRAPFGVQITWRSVLYLIGLLLGFIGFLGIAIDQRYRARKLRELRES